MNSRYFFYLLCKVSKNLASSVDSSENGSTLKSSTHAIALQIILLHGI